MKRKTAISLFLASALAMTATLGFAQGGPGGGGPSGGPGGGAGNGAMDRMHQMDRDQTFDRDRMQDRDRTQDRQQIHDPAQMADADIYGSALMSNAERRQYRQQLAAAESEQARQAYQLKHEQVMQQRALQQGVDLVPPGQGPVYGGALMSVQERNEFREQIRQAATAEERNALMAQHRELIQERARALNLNVDDVE